MTVPKISLHCILKKQQFKIKGKSNTEPGQMLVKNSKRSAYF